MEASSFRHKVVQYLLEQVGVQQVLKTRGEMICLRTLADSRLGTRRSGWRPARREHAKTIRRYASQHEIITGLDIAMALDLRIESTHVLFSSELGFCNRLKR